MHYIDCSVSVFGSAESNKRRRMTSRDRRAPPDVMASLLLLLAVGSIPGAFTAAT
jgi:hypothetical protein